MSPRQQSVTDLAHCAAAARQPGDMVGRRLRARMRIGDRKGQPDRTQQRHIRFVVADESRLRRRHTDLQRQGAEIPDLVPAALDHVPDAELPAAARDGRRPASRNDGDADPRARQGPQSVAILDVEALQLLAADPVVQAAVGEDAIDIQNQQANRRRG